VQDEEFLRYWFVSDPESGFNLGARRFNWNMLLGLALASIVSGTFWAGMAVTLAHLWK
jgi:hypothetical protein